MSKVVGIDLGTTNSLVAYVKDGVPVVIRDKNGDALVPSVVSVTADDTVYVGREAERRLLTDASRTVYSVKRFMGKGIEDVRGETRHFPFRVGGDEGERRSRSHRSRRARVHTARDLRVHSARAEASGGDVLCRPGGGRA